MSTDGPVLRLDVRRHTKYFLRCLKTYLPQPYTSNDSNRLSLAFFIISGLDLLGTLDENITAQERADYIAWIYSNQHADGGFRGSPATDLGAAAQSEAGSRWDPANLPATFFALCLLLILEDDFGRLERDRCLDWLPKLQRDDGSFGETTVDGVIRGGRDSRFGYCASGIRYILGGQLRRGRRSRRLRSDVRTEKLVECVRSAESYDGGFADEPFHESHAGFTFCGLAALSLLGRLDSSPPPPPPPPSPPAPSHRDRTVAWLVSRQTATITDADDPFDPSPAGGRESLPEKATTGAGYVGVNGRPNKVGDTCYAFWVSGSLALLGARDLLETERIRRWLLEKTSHPALGGFGKVAGEVPDLYHSYLGLATLGVLATGDVVEVDTELCISSRARERSKALWQRWDVDDGPG